MATALRGTFHGPTIAKKMVKEFNYINVGGRKHDKLILEGEPGFLLVGRAVVARVNQHWVGVATFF